MIRSCFGFLFFWSVICGCSSNTTNVDVEKWAPVIADIHIAEAAIINQPPEVKDSLNELYHQQIAEIHGIGVQELQQFMTEMQTRPTYIEPIYERALEILNEREVNNQQ